MQPLSFKALACHAGCAVFSLALATAAHGAPAENILYNFDITGGGSHPQAALTPGPGGIYYGTADNGGATGNGCVFALIPPGANETKWTEKTLYSFSGAPDGATPSSGLLLGGNGVLYGVTGAGGAQGAGVVFSLTPPASGQHTWRESVLYTFTGNSDGRAPFGTLVMDANGVLYGSTAGGGDTNGDGVVFSLTPPASGGAWTEAVLYQFQGNTDGASPGAGLLLDQTGALFGVTSVGGQNGGGTVYELMPPAQSGAAWTKTTLYNFTGQSDGGFPVGGLVMGADSVLYGVAAAGGSSGAGTVFSLTPPARSGKPWKEAVLYSFTGGLDGASPDSTLVLDPSGALYGTSNGGGTAGSGTVFALTPPAAGQKQWTEAALASFNGPNGSNPVGLGLAADGALIGTSFYGGSARKGGGGTVFLLTPPANGQTAWTQTELVQFRDGGPDAVAPTGALLLSKTGIVYGTSMEGGAFHDGAVYALTPPAVGQTAWTETVLHSFNGRDGSFPTGELVQDKKGVLYGTTSGGGPSADQGSGTVFALAPPQAGQTVWTETVLHAFKGVSAGDGAYPGSGVIADSTGALYGTTGYGGTANANDTDGNGIVFKLTPPAAGKTSWTETILYSFTGPDGATPEGTLLAGKGGVLYGTTYIGGSAGEGTVFSLAPPTSGGNWTEAVLHSFNASVGNDGAIPGDEQLIQDAAGALYGTASQGGLNNDGAVFKLAPPGNGGTVWAETLIHNFSGTDGIAPFVGLLANRYGTLYGVAEQGGDLSSCASPFGSGCGTVFKLTPPASGTTYTATVLHTFEPAYGRDGSDPAGALIKDGKGTILGTAAGGGFGGGGVVFEVTP